MKRAKSKSPRLNRQVGAPALKGQRKAAAREFMVDRLGGTEKDASVGKWEHCAIGGEELETAYVQEDV
jgi:hypothetical protein